MATCVFLKFYKIYFIYRPIMCPEALRNCAMTNIFSQITSLAFLFDIPRFGFNLLSESFYPFKFNKVLSFAVLQTKTFVPFNNKKGLHSCCCQCAVCKRCNWIKCANSKSKIPHGHKGTYVKICSYFIHILTGKLYKYMTRA